MIASNPAKAGLSSGTLKSQDISNIPALWPSTNLEMTQIIKREGQRGSMRAAN
jgi:hypothetical protein